MDDPTLAYQLTFDQRDGYLYAHVKAETIDQESALSYLREVAARCDELETTHLMLYRDIPVMLPDGVLFFVATEFLEMIRGVTTAFVNPYASNEDAFNFALMVGKNRGGNYALFNNTAEAEIWLRKE